MTPNADVEKNIARIQTTAERIFSLSEEGYGLKIDIRPSAIQGIHSLK